MIRLLLAIASAVWLGETTSRVPPPADNEPAAAKAVERFTATASTSAVPGTRPLVVTLEIVIDRWSTKAERDRVIDTLKVRGSGALLDLFRGLPSIGHISTSTSPGSSLRFAESRPAADGGRQIILAAERPMHVANERQRGRRTDDYPFSVVEIRFDRGGSGSGTLAYSSRLAHNRQTGALEIDSYATEPVRLTSVQSVRDQ